MTISYDAIGNPLSDGTWYYTWVQGRQLQSMESISSGAAWIFTYNADGMRTKRTNGSTTYKYTYHGSQLTHMERGSVELHFSYDASGSPMAVVYNNNTYYYLLNQQGDVVGILDSSGTQVVAYTYDAWGRPLSTTGTMASSLGQYNPLRYRGYVYDEETQLYYLQSRYYNPTWGRFLNSDSLVSTGQGILGNNMFAYCGNNPVMNIDPIGLAWYDTAWNWVNTIAGFLNPISTLTAIASLTVAAAQGRWEDIEHDWNSGSLNPFNQSEDVATNSKVLGFYKGSSVVRQDVIGTSSMFGTIWAESGISSTTLNHEYGHSVQERFMGPKFLSTVAIPSVSYYWYDVITSGSTYDYYSTPWERTADWLGGVNRNEGYKSGSLAWGIAENILGPAVIPIYLLLGF